ncbi:acyl-CoA desaturase [Viridibacterium curvum]|uniref:Acyl-CoA desaturase n=1 Tax=Viridibacterium curvum TaxID=1101404 RepID=A0ABP9QDY7_9RHOO
MNATPANTSGTLSFAPRSEFFNTLKSRVDAYFTDNGVSTNGNALLYSKALLGYGLIIGGYISLVWGVSSLWAALVAGFLLAQGYIIVAFNVMHDGAHGSYSKKRWVNWLAGATMDVIGSSQMLWRQKHNLLHHTYPNIDGKDDDISIGALMRLSPNQRWYPWHRLQALYAPVLYAMLTMYLGLFSDFHKLISNRIGTTPLQQKAGWEIPWFIVHKAAYLGYTLVLPSFFHPFSHVVLAFVGVHAVFGLVLSLVFQLAHTVEGTDFPLPDAQRKMENEWAVHQMNTTADFAPTNWLATYYMGGLNYQVEHHLFHKISHVHYPQIAAIVRKTCDEFSVRYLCFPSVTAALKAHFKFLHRLGRRPITT